MGHVPSFWEIGRPCSRWNIDAALGVTCTRTATQPPGMDDPFASIEESAEVHLDPDADLIWEIEGDDAQPPTPPLIMPL